MRKPRNPYFDPGITNGIVTDQDGNQLTKIKCPKCDTILHVLSNRRLPENEQAWQCSACNFIIVARNKHGQVELGNPGREIEGWNQ